MLVSRVLWAARDAAKKLSRSRADADADADADAESPPRRGPSPGLVRPPSSDAGLEPLESLASDVESMTRWTIGDDAPAEYDATTEPKEIPVSDRWKFKNQETPTAFDDIAYRERWAKKQAKAAAEKPGTIEEMVEAITALELHPPGADAKTIADAVATGRRNNFAVTDSLLAPVASGCYPLGALLNHSCAPNAVISYRLRNDHNGGGRPREDSAADLHAADRNANVDWMIGGGGVWAQEFRVVKHVAAGEELTHAYVDASDPIAARQKILTTRYGFKCLCARCGEGKPMTGCRGGKLNRPNTAVYERALEIIEEAMYEKDLDREKEKAHQAVHVLAVAMDDMGEGEYGPSMSFELKDVDPEELATRYGPSPTVSARVRALHIAFNAAMLEGDWPYARGLGASLILGREAAFGTAYHPRVGLDLVTLAGVAAEAGDYFAAKETLHKAQEILEITCGKNSKLFKDTLVLYDRIVEVETERTMTPTTPSPMPPLVDNKAN